MAKPKQNAPGSRSNKAKRKRLRQRRQRAPEAVVVERDEAALALAASRRHTRNPQQTLHKLSRGELCARDLPAYSYLHGLALLIEDARREGRAHAAAAAQLAEVTPDLVQADPSYTVALHGLVRHHASWLRSPASFRCPTRSAGRRFAALLRHLLARYPVPALFDQAFTQGQATHQEWFVHLGRGENLRKAPGLPFPLTKRMAHFVLQAPADTPIEHALCLGWALGLGVRPRLARAVLGTRLARHLPAEHEPFWRDVLRWGEGQPALSPHQLAPIVDYLHHQRFVTPPGADGPARPNLAMRQRRLPTLLREVEAWHAQLGRIAAAGRLSWEHDPTVQDLLLRETSAGFPADDDDDAIEYRMVQLLNSRELVAEGRALRHCVATYARGCAAGRCTIWSLRRCEPQGAVSLATVEVHRATRTVIQARGRANTIPGPRAWRRIDRWVRENGLSVSRWVPRS